MPFQEFVDQNNPSVKMSKLRCARRPVNLMMNPEPDELPKRRVKTKPAPEKDHLARPIVGAEVALGRCRPRSEGVLKKVRASTRRLIRPS